MTYGNWTKHWRIEKKNRKQLNTCSQFNVKSKMSVYYDVKDFLTCTGIGQKILLSVGKEWNCPALIRFHLARRFCHQIFTCISLRFNVWAIYERSTSDKYFFCWNSDSNSSNCSLVNAVRLRRIVDELLFNDELSSSSVSLGVGQFKLSIENNTIEWNNQTIDVFTCMNITIFIVMISTE